MQIWDYLNIVIKKIEHRTWEDTLRLSTIPLRSLSAKRMPVGAASGCIFDYNGYRILLTVQHATGNNSNWAAEVRYEKSRGTQLYQLGAMNFLSMLDLNFPEEIQDVDFAYVGVPINFETFYQEIQPNGNVSFEEKRILCHIDFELEPKSDREFGFSGLVLPELTDNQLWSKLRLYNGLKFEGSTDDYYIFKLPFKHPGHENFKGCSGAPIIDDHGNTVSLVCGGSINDNTIFGISLKRYQVALQISFT